MKRSVRRGSAFLLVLVLLFALFPAKVRAEEPAVIPVDVGAANIDTDYYAIRNNDVWLKRSDAVYELTGSTDKPVRLWNSSLLSGGVHVRLNNVSVNDFFYYSGDTKGYGAMTIEVPEGTVNSLGRMHRISDIDISGGGVLNCTQINMFPDDGAEQHLSVSDTQIHISLPAGNLSNDWCGKVSISGTANVTIQNAGDQCPLRIQSGGASLTMTDQAELHILQKENSDYRTSGLKIDGPITLNDSTVLEVHAQNNVKADTPNPAIESYTDQNLGKITVAKNAHLIAVSGTGANGSTTFALDLPYGIDNSGTIDATIRAYINVSNTGSIQGDVLSYYGSVKNQGTIEGNVTIRNTWYGNQLVNDGTIKGDVTLPTDMPPWTGDGLIQKSDGSIETSTDNDNVLHYTVTTADCTADTPGEGPLKGYGACGSTVTLTFFVPAGKRLSGWKTQPADLSINDSFQFTMPDEPVTVEPVYENLPSYTVAVQIDPADGGSVTGADSYYEGDTAALSAEPADGFRFLRWMENGQTLSEDTEISFTADRDRSLTAVFEAIPERQISLRAEPADGGTVDGAGTYRDGDTASVSAEPAEGFRFLHWTENGQTLPGEAAFSFTVDKDRSLTAVFEAIPERQISLRAEPAGGGTVDGAGIYRDGDTASVSAGPAEGFRFLHWTENGQTLSDQAVFSFTVDSDRSLTAVFEAIPKERQISLRAEPAGGGTVDGGGTYRDGDTASVSAGPADGFRFLHWTENGQTLSDQAVFSFTVDSDRSLTAVFEAIPEDPSQPTEPSQPEDPSQPTEPSQPEDPSQPTEPSRPEDPSQPTEPSQPEDPSQPTEPSRPEDPSQPTEPSRPTEPSAPAERQISLRAEPADGGTLSGGGTYRDGSHVTVSAIPADGYRFSHWIENGKPLTTNASFLITVAGDRSLTAVFTRVPSSDSDKPGGGNHSGGSSSGGDNSGATGSRPAGAPATGDTAGIWPLLLMLSGSSAALLLYRRQKRQNSN